VELPLVRSPAGSVVRGQNPVNPIRGQEAIGDALLEAIRVERVAEVDVGVSVVLPERRGRHSELGSWVEGLQDVPPVAVVTSGAAMALVHDDEIEEVRGVFLEESRPAFILGDGLISGEVHLPALDRLTFLDLVPGISEGSKRLVLRVIDEN